jgi:hypothetical protein
MNASSAIRQVDHQQQHRSDLMPTNSRVEYHTREYANPSAAATNPDASGSTEKSNPTAKPFRSTLTLEKHQIAALEAQFSSRLARLDAAKELSSSASGSVDSTSKKEQQARKELKNANWKTLLKSPGTDSNHLPDLRHIHSRFSTIRRAASVWGLSAEILRLLQEFNQTRDESTLIAFTRQREDFLAKVVEYQNHSFAVITGGRKAIYAEVLHQRPNAR